MSQVTPREPLDPLTASRLTDFARACKGATRAVSLYPNGHPAIDLSLSRLVDVSTRATEGGPLRITVLPSVLVVNNRAIARPDASIGELAALLHDHLIGELEVLSGADATAWRSLLMLLAQSPIDVQSQGGVARLWTTAGGQHVRIREVDYAQVLRERTAGIAASWDTIVQYCLQDDAVELDERSLAALFEVAHDRERLVELTSRLDSRAAAAGGVRIQADAIARLLQRIRDEVAQRQPDRLESALANMARATGHLSPEVMVGLLAQRAQSAGQAPLDVVTEVVARMDDETVGGFIAQSVLERRGATERLVEAFQALVPEEGRRPSVLDRARDELAGTPLGSEEDFTNLWKQASTMLLSYRDESFVSDAYARELSGARGQAEAVERISDDPPEQVAVWLETTSDASLRAVDLELLLDLLRLETDAARWRQVAAIVTAHVNDLVLLGDFESAEPLLAAISDEAGPGGRPTHRPAAADAIDRSLQSQLMTYLVGHLRTIDDSGFERARSLVRALGPAAVRPLAEALALEEKGRAFRRLTELLVDFGSAGREAAEQLRTSPNPAVRRTAIYLLREFGGHDALPELTSLLDDAEVNVQREAIRAIALIGTDQAYAVLERALTSGTERQREAIVNALGSMRDERAVPLFCHMVRSDEYRRRMRSAYLTALEGLGSAGGAEAIAALTEALYRGEWYAPFRTATLRRAAATALRRIGSQEAFERLRQAAENGRRGVRAVAREQLALANETGGRRARPA